MQSYTERQRAYQLIAQGLTPKGKESRKTVFSAGEIPHAWVHMKSDRTINTKASGPKPYAYGGSDRHDTYYRTNQSSVMATYDTFRLYSSDIAQRYQDEQGEDIFLISTRGDYSQTTQSYLSAVRGAIPHGHNIYYTPELDIDRYSQSSAAERYLNSIEIGKLMKLRERRAWEVGNVIGQLQSFLDFDARVKHAKYQHLTEGLKVEIRAMLDKLRAIPAYVAPILKPQNLDAVRGFTAYFFSEAGNKKDAQKKALTDKFMPEGAAYWLAKYDTYCRETRNPDAVWVFGHNGKGVTMSASSFPATLAVLSEKQRICSSLGMCGTKREARAITDAWLALLRGESIERLTILGTEYGTCLNSFGGLTVGCHHFAPITLMRQIVELSKEGK